MLIFLEFPFFKFETIFLKNLVKISFILWHILSSYEVVQDAQKFTFFRLLHTSTSKATNKEKMCFVCGWKFWFFVIFTGSKGKKQLPIPFPWSFWLDMWKCTTKQQCLHIKTRLQSIGTLNSRPKENLQLYKKLAKKRFLN